MSKFYLAANDNVYDLILSSWSFNCVINWQFKVLCVVATSMMLSPDETFLTFVDSSGSCNGGVYKLSLSDLTLIN